MKRWLHDLRDAGIRIIVVSNNSKNVSNEQLKNLGLITSTGLEAIFD